MTFWIPFQKKSIKIAIELLKYSDTSPIKFIFPIKRNIMQFYHPKSNLILVHYME